MDFTLDSYFQIIDAGLNASYQPLAVVDLFKEPSRTDPHIVLRHDVDRHPENALAMAKGEARRGVRATYYFRTISKTLKPDIISAIADLGHEIGYHYEDFHAARYDSDKAWDQFCDNLERLRNIAPIETIAMHGSPLAKFNNMELWKYHAFAERDVQDCILSFDWGDYAFFTDTGRSFAAGRTNLRDKIGGKSHPDIATSPQLAAFLRDRVENKIQISTHPERWNTPGLSWVRQWGQDTAVNLIKLGLQAIR